MILERPIADNLELIARQVVEGFIIGLHKSPFHGFSVEFAEHRLYNPGDPLRYIDWRVFGRTDKLFIKRFEEETNLRCCLVIDTSSSMQFPQDEKKVNKLQFSCIAAASLIQLLKRQLDAASLVLFDDKVNYFSQCRSAHSHYRQLTTELQNTLSYQSADKKTNTAAALHLIAEQMHRRSLVVIFSDMIDEADDVDALFSALQHLRYNKHEVILFHVMDGSQELDFEFENRPYEFVDMESGDRIKLQPQQIKEQYVNRMKEFQQVIENKCHQYQIDRIKVDLSQPVDEVLHAFLVKRNKLM
ncbi:DUF58 domain-containing protein [Flavipsychrobacter stenotrophus]|uniref:DUF58 domain-containing protein n=1 Tax=Flavipsychrobacter stenotrophus TaxID=2077091 RepID=A0A2S7T2F8_9BACT|nr:DUF58 domain-containing protein [Flavipsychrobacter stenotrophus]PQJ13061.1 DUF58 domain-containing protein [Flavipsychrobacter stenotrophus]